MRAKLMIARVLWCVLPLYCLGERKNTVEVQVLFSAPSEDALRAWAKTRGYGRWSAYNRDNNKVIVLLLDCGSGVWLDSIYVYRMSDSEKKWRLVLLRPTGTKVTVKEKNGTLVFTTDTGTIILEQSLNAVGSFSEAVWEQPKEANVRGVVQPTTVPPKCPQ